jgi:hypothetical protein
MLIIYLQLELAIPIQIIMVRPNLLLLVTLSAENLEARYRMILY